MPSEERSLKDIFKDIRNFTGQTKESAINEMALRIRDLFSKTGYRYKIKNQAGQDFSDIIQIALRSFMSDIQHNRLDLKDSWEDFSLGYLRNKIKIHIRDAKILTVNSDSLNQHPAVADSKDYNQMIMEIANALPFEDKTRTVFVEVVKGDLTLKQIADNVGTSERTVNSKKRAIMCHFANSFLNNENLSPEVKDTIALIFNPQTCVSAAKPKKGERLSEMERRIIAAADKMGISVKEMTKRAQSALHKLAKLIDDSKS